METFTCPQCGSKTDYDPERVGRDMRVEEKDGQTWWSDYCIVRRAQCGHEGLVLRSRTPLPP